MPDAISYQLLADTVLALHVAVVAFVIGGLLVVPVGKLCRWHWVDGLWFRLAHLAAVAGVVVQAWMGATCPLTSLEMWLRARARTSSYSGSCIEHWLQQLLYYQAPPWVFTLGYTLFGLLVAASWIWFPPARRRR